jgi:hypothetical protein
MSSQKKENITPTARSSEAWTFNLFFFFFFIIVDVWIAYNWSSKILKLIFI